VGEYQGEEEVCYSMSRVRGAVVFLGVRETEGVLCVRYYEWLTKGKDKLPHFTKRSDGALLMMAGLYDCATIEG